MTFNVGASAAATVTNAHEKRAKATMLSEDDNATESPIQLGPRKSITSATNKRMATPVPTLSVSHNQRVALGPLTPIGNALQYRNSGANATKSTP